MAENELTAGAKRSMINVLNSGDDALLDSAPMGIFHIDSEGKFVYVNRTLAERYGMNPDDFKGKLIGLIFLDKVETDILKSGIPLIGRIREIQTPGGTRWERVDTVPVKGADGKVTGMVGFAVDITELKRADRVLRESEERFRQVVERIAEGVIVQNDRGIITFVNDGLCELLGYQCNELIGRLVSVFFDPFNREILEEQLRQVREDEYDKRPIPISLIRKNGKRVPALMSLTPTFDAEGRFTGSFAIFTDLSQLKRAEGAVRESEETARALLNATIDSALLVDLDGYILAINEIAAQCLGKRVAELVGTCVYDYFDPYLVKFRKAKLKEVISSGKPLRFEEEVDGRILESSIYPVVGANRMVDRVAIFSQNITNRKRAEEALRKSEASYRELADSITDVFFAMDKDLKYTYWNKASENLVGISAREAIGKSLYELFPDVKGTKIEELYLEALRTQQSLSFVQEYKLRGKDFIFEINVYPSRCGLSVFVKDLTERRRMEEALRISENRYCLLAENVTDIIWTMDMNQRFTFLTPSVTRVLGYDVEELMAKGLEELLSPASYKLAMKTLTEELAVDGMAQIDPYRSRVLELELNCKDGSTVWVETKMTFLRDPKGRAIEILGVARDITDRKRVGERRACKKKT
jgi:PAS domain S-box-containing protein